MPGLPPPPSITVIGCGRFGRFLTEQLAPIVGAAVWDADPTRLGDLPAGARPVSWDEACAGEVLVLAVPIRALPALLDRLGKQVRPRSLVIDTASVKVWPMRWMRASLPGTVQILGTHPLFGPDSAPRGLDGQRLVLVPERVRYPHLVRRTLESLGLRCVETTAEGHDREIAETQALTHWIGRALERCGARPRDVDTLGYRRLLEILRYVENDSWELFEDLERWNPYARPVRQRFLEALAHLDDEIGDSDRGDSDR